MLVSSGFLGHVPVMWEKVISMVHEPGKPGIEDFEAFCVAEAAEASTRGCLRVPREGPRPSALAVPLKAHVLDSHCRNAASCELSPPTTYLGSLPCRAD